VCTPDRRRLQQCRRIHEFDAASQHVGHRADRAIGVLRRELLQDAQEGQVGTIPPAKSCVFDLPCHHGVRDACLFEDLDVPRSEGRRSTTGGGVGKVSSRAATIVTS
jgi:hypothetical protein